MLASQTDLSSFAATMTRWQRDHGRHHLPWQHTRDPYRVWLSEIMLQQTQVGTVLGYYARFLARFPTVAHLARASQDEVMPYWAGLGYYARARNLHRCAQEILEQWGGEFPTNAEALDSLPGIGRSTAAAIAAFCYGERSPIMDGNVKRVFTRYFGIYGETQRTEVDTQLWNLAEQIVASAPADLDMAAYTQSLMDLGSQCCTRSKPACTHCPLQTSCFAYTKGVQQELPTKKTRKVQDERFCHMLILQSGTQIVVEQRPGHGIWGGLLSLPEFTDEQDMRLQARGYGVHDLVRLASLQHVFSHFKLHISPWLGLVDSARLAEPGGEQRVWLPLESISGAALPAPVRKILDGLYLEANPTGKLF